MNWFLRLLAHLCPAPCPEICGKPLHRLHWSCLHCRERRYARGKLDKTKYFVHPNGHVIVPLERITYTLFIDCNRPLGTLKNRLLWKLLTIAEFLAD